jgi:hypothetical protein
MWKQLVGDFFWHKRYSIDKRLVLFLQKIKYFFNKTKIISFIIDFKILKEQIDLGLLHFEYIGIVPRKINRKEGENKS